MKYHLISLAILLGALGFYALGGGAGGTLCLLAAVAHEAWFWVRLRRRVRTPS